MTNNRVRVHKICGISCFLISRDLEIIMTSQRLIWKTFSNIREFRSFWVKVYNDGIWIMWLWIPLTKNVPKDDPLRHFTRHSSQILLRWLHFIYTSLRGMCFPLGEKFKIKFLFEEIWNHVLKNACNAMLISFI